MIPVPTGVRAWLATGHTDMRRGFPSLSLQVQEVLRRDPLSGHLFCFRGRRGDLLAGRGRDRDAGGDLAPLEGDPDGAGALQLPGVRADHAAAVALPRHAAWLRRPAAAGHDPVREV